MPGSPAQADRYLAAIKRLKAKGEAITVRAVRDKAGGGSMTVVNAVVRDWREKRRKATQRSTVTRMLGTAVRDELARRHGEENAQRKGRSIFDALDEFNWQAKPLIKALEAIKTGELKRVLTSSKALDRLAFWEFLKLIDRLAAWQSRIPPRTHGGTIPDWAAAATKKATAKKRKRRNLAQRPRRKRTPLLERKTP